jgi:hypothetical protein
MPKKRLSQLSLRGRRALFSSKRELLRGNAANISTYPVINGNDTSELRR